MLSISLNVVFVLQLYYQSYFYLSFQYTWWEYSQCSRTHLCYGLLLSSSHSSSTQVTEGGQMGSKGLHGNGTCWENTGYYWTGAHRPRCGKENAILWNDSKNKYVSDTLFFNVLWYNTLALLRSKHFYGHLSSTKNEWECLWYRPMFNSMDIGSVLVV